MKKLVLNEICQLLNGYAFKSKQYVDDGIRIIRIANVQKGKIVDDAPCFYPINTKNEIEKYMLSENDLLISLTGNVGRVGLLTKDMLPAALNQRVSCIRILDKDVVFFKYLYYYLQQNTFERDCIKASNGVAQLNLSTKWLENYEIYLPSLEEQQRIVAKIEELFSKLDKGVEELNRIKEQLKIYRQAVLKEAFDGKSSFGNFETCEISNLVDDIKIGPFGTMLHKEDYINNGVPVINPQHIKAGAIVNSPNISVSRKKALELSSYKLQINDIIMGRRGEMGRVAPVTNVEEGWICGTGSILFRLKPEYDAKFYSKILESPDSVHYLEENATGTTMKNLDEKIVKHIPVPKITRTQQADIMSEVDRKLSVCDKIEQTVNESLQKAESLRQSILKQAFEGGL